MADPKLLELLKKGVPEWNRWRSNKSLAPLDLSKVDLREAYLSGAYLSQVNLGEADLSGANLSGAHLSRVYLSGADLGKTYLSGAFLGAADLSRANLRGANLRGADLSAANLQGADLTGANLGGAMLYKTVFGNTNLTNVKGLDTCYHSGPSILDYRTLEQSGPLPLAFLRGCGLPDTLIAYLPSMLNQPIQFYSCFISYSTKDQEFADRLWSDLQSKGVRCWFAPHDMEAGKKLHEQIDQAIRVNERLLLLLSPASMSSEWVKTEIAKARKRELQEERRVLFPLRLVDFTVLRDWECFDADAGKDSAREIREYHVPDFSNWKDHDAYKKEFDKLLRDLKKKEP
jgi:hypothetical protein